ncbi:hypothetical protein KDK95_25580 [Actinospica sp. MGRD01-02]|uniref:Laminin G domain-containing protein n=1 Tax=Actinospica acidithermotolerans TaxID=2828514 RepID=A0A941EFC9_9ACTN|nr:LamG-like jellyroll fold domain-containing protein [Actinospica acidithermotolerans]MBR7829703.1 hypothetical protein [Actinospica acidithermotolerans]
MSSLVFLLLVLTSATQSATAAQLTPGRSPFSIGAGALASLWRHAKQWVDETSASLPAQGHGSGSAAHSTKADVGAGRSPGTGAGQQPLAGSTTAHTVGGKSSTITKGFNVKTSKRLPGKSSAYATWWQNADGTQTEQVSQTVVNYKDSSGSWQPIDTTLTKGSDGRWQVAAAGYGLALAAGVASSNAATSAFDPGSGAFSTPFASTTLTHASAENADTTASDAGSSTGTLATLTVASGESIAWSLQGAASVAASEAGSTVTYPSILPDTDLSLSSESSGVKESLVLSSASAPNSWTFPLTLTGLSLNQASDGTWQLLDASGAVAATLASPFALDSSNTAAGESQGVTYSLATVDGVEQLTMTLSSSWLEDPTRVFPVTVDPTITVSTAGSGLSTYVDNADPSADNANKGVLNVGYDGSGENHAYINFPSSVITSDLQNTGYHITSAQFAAYMASGSTSSSYPFDVYSVGTAWTPSTLNANVESKSMTWYQDLGTYAGSTSSAATCSGLSNGFWLYTPLSASDMDTFALNELAWYGVMIKADSETNGSYFRVFGSASNASCSPYISLTYTPDVVPTVSTMSPASGYVQTSLTPELTASGTDPDSWPNSSVQYEFQVFNSANGTTLANSGPPIAKSSLLSNGSWAIPKGTLKWGNSYWWTVCVWDGFKCGAETANTFQTSTPGPVLTQNLSQSTSGHGFDVATGNYTTSATDADIAGIGPSLNVVRDYNSLDTRKSGAFGAQWSSLVDATATQELDSAGNLIGVAVTYPDGSVVVFGYNSSDGSYSPPEGRFATLLEIRSSGSLVGYTLTDKSGTTYTFGAVVTAAVAGSSSGTYTTAGVFGISQVADVGKHTLTFMWGVTGGVSGSHVLSETSQTSGRSLYFTWATPSGAEYPHVSVVTTSLADSSDSSSYQYWSYAYQGDHLWKVYAPDPTTPSALPTSSSAYTKYSYTVGSDFQQAVLGTSPYQYWPMDDATGYSSSLSLVGANIGDGRAYYTGMSGDVNAPTGPFVTTEKSSATGALFDGTTSFMTLPTGMVLNTTYVSVGMWFKTSYSGPLFTEQNMNIAETPTNATMSLYVGTDGYLRGGWYTGVNGSAGQIEDTKAKVNDGAWHYVVLSGAGSTQTMYVDGKSVGSLNGTVNNLGQTYEYVGGGYSSGQWPGQAAAGNWHFKGSISDVAVYKSALSSTEVASLNSVGNTPIDWLTEIDRPRAVSQNTSEKPAATVTYNSLDGRVESVTDGNGGTWTLSDPTAEGSGQVFRETVMGDRPAFYYRLGDAADSKYASDEVNADAWANAGLAAQYSGVTLGTTQSAFADSYAGTFDGSSSYMTLPSGLAASAPVSIGLWFNAKSGMSGPLFTTQDTGLTGTPSHATNDLYVGTNGLLYGSFSMGTQTAIASKDKVDDGQWHYVVLTASGSSESLYLDGALQGTVSGTYTYAGQGVDLIGAGYSSGDWQNQGAKGSDWYFNGSISDAAFFYSQLSQVQVTQLWQGYHNSLGSEVPLELFTVTDPADSYSGTSHTETYEFDPAHSMREIKHIDGLGGVTTYSYDTNGFQDVVTDPNGDQTITGHDVRGNVVSTTTCQYQAENKCSTSYKTYYPDDTTASFTASTLDPRDDQVLTSSDGRSESAGDATYRTTYTYDAYGNLKTTTGPATTQFPAGTGVTNVYTTATSDPACDPSSATLGAKSSTQYAPVDLLSSSTTTGGAVTTYAYYPDGDTCMVQNADHLRTYFVYDGLGRVVKKVVEGGDTILANMVGYTGAQTTTYAYDGDGRVIQATAPAVSDQVNQNVVHTAVTTQTYDADGNLTCTSVADATGGDTARKITYTYNNDDQKQTYTSANGYASTNGSCSDTTAPSGHTASYTYDLFGNVETQTDELTGTATRTTETLYDAANLLRVTELLNTNPSDGTYSSGSVLTADTKTYDAAGRLETDEQAPTTQGKPGYYTCYYYYDNNLLYQQIKTDSSCPASAMTTSQGDITNTQVISTEFYDGAGNVVTKVTNNGRTETDDVYNPDGTLATSTLDPNSQVNSTTTVDPTGVDRTTAYTYNADGYVTETVGQTDANNVLAVVSDVKESYDGLGNVMTKTVVDGTHSYETIYTLDQRGLPTQIQDPDGNVTTTVYDAAGHLVQTTSPNVPVTLWCQTATTYAVCNSGNVGTAVTENVPAVTTVGYDTFGDEVESENADGQTTTATYDAEGNKTSVTLPSYTTPAPTSATLTATTTYQYDADGELIAQTDPVAVASSNTKGEQTTYTYTMLGQVARKTSTDLGNATATPATTSYTYDADGDTTQTVTAISASQSLTTAAAYDYLSRPTSSSTIETHPTDGTTTSTYTTTDVYGAGGWLATSTTNDDDTTTYGYDNAGDKTSVTDNLKHTTTYGYDGAGRLTTTTLPDTSSTQVAYDEAGNKTSTATYAPGGTTQLSGTTMSYDGDGLLRTSETQTPDQTSYNASNTETTTYSYDATGLLTSEVAPLTGSSTVTVSYGYDPAGNKTSYADGNTTSTSDTTHTTYWTYNPWDLPETKVVPATSSNSTLASRSTTTTYDADGRATLVSEPVATATSTPITVASSYDGYGDLTSQTSAGAEGTNTTRTFGYDLTGQLTSAGTQNSSGGQLTSESYTYDDRGNLTNATGAAGTSSFTYNGDGQMTSRTDASGTTGYTYNPAAADQLTAITDAATGTSLGYSYNSLGQTSKITYGSGDTRSFGYNTAHELISDTLATSSGSTVQALGYSWDTDGNLLTKTDSSGTSNTYTYDASGRLSTWSNGATSTTYSYDADSNRTEIATKTTSSGTTTSDEKLTYDQRDELTGTTDSVTTASSSYTYTPRGTTSQVSTVTATGATGTTSYADDAFGQQTNAGTAGYTYDAVGRLTSQSVGSTTTSLQYSGATNNVAADGTNTYSRDPNGSLIGTADTTAGTSGLLWTDLHTDVVGEFTATGTTLNGTETYDPLGNVTSDTGTAKTLTVGYQSEYTDSSTGAVNMAARWYNPKSGQFTSTDTVENSATPNTANANPFAYADGSPLDATDPSGHCPVDKCGADVPKAGNYTAAQYADPTSAAYTHSAQEVAASRVISYYAASLEDHCGDRYGCFRSGMRALATVKVSANGTLTARPDVASLLTAAIQAQTPSSEPNDGAASSHEKCGWTSIGGCFHNAEVWVDNHPVIKDVMSVGIGLAVAGACEVGSLGIGTIGCAALGGAATAGFDYAIAGDATGTGTVTGLFASMAVGAAAGAAAAATGGTVSAAVTGLLGEGTAATVVAGTAAGTASGFAGGSFASAGGYLTSCGSNCSAGGMLHAALSGGMSGALTGGALGAAASAVGAAGADVPGCVAHSFIGTTGVLMADGTIEPIDHIKVGDEITDSAPGKTDTQTHKVKAVIVTHTDHDFVDVTIKPLAASRKTKLAKTAATVTAATLLALGANSATTGSATTQAVATRPTTATAATDTLTTTFHHPFYDVTQGAFVQAQYLKTGDELQTPTGTAEIANIHLYHANTTTYDLTIGELHTYYVLAGSTPVLVHNCGTSVDVQTPSGVVQTDVSTSGDLQAYADFLRPNYTKSEGPVFAAKYTSPSGRSYFGYSGHDLVPEEGGAVDSLAQEFTPPDGRYHVGCAETMCLILAENAEGAAGIEGGSFEVVKVRGLNSGPGSVHGDPAGPCPLVCQPRLNNQGITY